MRIVITISLLLFTAVAMAQPVNRIKLRQLQAAGDTTSNYRILSNKDTAEWALVGVDSIQYVSDTTTLSPHVGDRFVNSTKDTAGFYRASGGWLLFYGGAGGGGSTEEADGLTILGAGTSGDPFRVNTDSLSQPSVTLDLQSPLLLKPCETSDTWLFTGTVRDDSIRAGDDITSLLSEDNEAAWTIVFVYEQDGFAQFELYGASLAAGSYSPEIYYKGNLVWTSLVTVEAQPCYTDTLSNYPDRTELADSTAAVRGDFPAGDNLGDHTATEDLQMDGFNIDLLGGAVVGGSGTGGDLNLISTSGAGDGSDDIIFFTGNNGGDERMRLKGSGNLGIGTSNPQKTLHVAGTARITGSDGAPTGLVGRDGDGDISGAGSGTQDNLALWTAAASLGDSYLSQSANALTLEAGKVFQITGMATASLPAATAGYFTYDTDDNRPKWSDGVEWFHYSPWVRQDGIYYNQGDVRIGDFLDDGRTFRVKGNAHISAGTASTFFQSYQLTVDGGSNFKGLAVQSSNSSSPVVADVSHSSATAAFSTTNARNPGVWFLNFHGSNHGGEEIDLMNMASELYVFGVDSFRVNEYVGFESITRENVGGNGGYINDIYHFYAHTRSTTPVQLDSIKNMYGITFDGIDNISAARNIKGLNMRNIDFTSPYDGTFNGVHIENDVIINQPGTATGISAGLNIEPTITAASDWRSINIGNVGSNHYAIKAGTGRIVFENYEFDTDQDTAGRDGHVMKFNSNSGQIELQSIPDQNATYYEETNRQYNITTTGADTLITIDTLSTALATDSISISSGLIENLKADTVRWQVRYDFFYKATDADLGIAFVDLTPDGTEVPTAIPGSKARAEQRSPIGVAIPGRTFNVDVPPGDKVRLCFKGDAGTTTAVEIRDLTISINEINR